MFICPKCSERFNLPKCNSCGNSIENQDDIWQLSNDPDIVIDGNSDKYIGYQYIGDSYSGNRRLLIEEKDFKFAREIANLIGTGVFLDLACGDGCIAVPAASLGLKVVAGDISNAMLKILKAKAESTNVSLRDTTLCRMNALNIPIADNSIDCVVANSVLHLISNPEKVVGEIHRVLKPKGIFICKDDMPGKAPSKEYNNDKYNKIVNSMYSRYWSIMKAYDVYPKRYSWRFDRDAVCDSIFKSKNTLLIDHHREYSIQMKDGFLPRFIGKGFSDQVEVPKDIHEQVVPKLLTEFKHEYGEHFDDIPFVGVESDILLTVYVK